MKVPTARRSRVALVALLIVSPSLLCIGLTIKTTSDLHLNQAKERNRDTARAISNLLDGVSVRERNALKQKIQKVVAQMPDTVSQPISAAQAANLSLLPRLLFLSLFVLALTLGMARALVGLYEKQERIRYQLAEQNRNLLASDQAKSEFLANVSHDLWTPLAGLQMSLSGLLNPVISWTPDQVRESLHLAHHELTQMIARVRNLLEMARLDAKANLAQKEPCDLVDIVGSALERLSPLLRGREVCADFPSYPLMLECRQEQFEIVLVNLLENAIKYSPAGSPLVLKGEKRGEALYCSLRDFGSGVAPEDTEKIFVKFYRAQKTHALGGTGLGLAIAKAVIEDHGGVIGVFNAPGGGAEFWFSVPGLPKESGE